MVPRLSSLGATCHLGSAFCEPRLSHGYRRKDFIQGIAPKIMKGVHELGSVKHGRGSTGQEMIPETPQGNHPLMDWGSFPHRDEEKGDYQLATWTIDQLKHASKINRSSWLPVSSCPTSLVMQPKPGLTGYLPTIRSCP